MRVSALCMLALIGTSAFLWIVPTTTEAQTLGDVYDGGSQPEDQPDSGDGGGGDAGGGGGVPPPSEPDSGDNSDDEIEIRWASSGGGWRAMFAAMGFANAFQQAGLFSANSSKLAAISTNSGGSWFSTQLFYSPQFYDQVVMEESPEALYDFSIRWMETYGNLSGWVIDFDPNLCDGLTAELGNSTVIEVFKEMCQLIVQYDGDWASFVSVMMLAASAEFGDPTLVNRTVTSAGRITPLQQTDLYVMTALAASSRIRTYEKIPLPEEVDVEEESVGLKGAAGLANEHKDDPFNRRRRKMQLFGPPDDTTIYLGPAAATVGDDIERLYTTAQGAAFVVDDDGQRFYYMSDSKESDSFRLYKGDSDAEYDPSEFVDFYGSGEVTIRNQRPLSLRSGWGELMEGKKFREPFGGAPQVYQIASISSAAVATMCPAAQLNFANTFNNAWLQVRESLGPLTLVPGRVIFNQAVNSIYTNYFYDTIAVCSQWPNPCGQSDGLFADGGLVENYALTPTISQYQRKNTNNDKPLKIILTNTNRYWIWEWDLNQLLPYFDSPATEGIEPGGKMGDNRSPQAFEDYLDLDVLNSLLEPIEGSNVTTVRMNLTTIDNPTFGIRKGLKVELLMINLNEDLITFITGPSIIANATIPHAEMVYKLATNEELIQRVRDFSGTSPSPDVSIQK